MRQMPLCSICSTFKMTAQSMKPMAADVAFTIIAVMINMLQIQYIFIKSVQRFSFCSLYKISPCIETEILYSC